ncbi:MAG: homocysteine S-methyltransferase [Saprospiraceae bacterium]
MLENIEKLKYPLLLDGGLSNELEAQGYDLSHQLWSAKLIANSSEAIIQAHLTYLKAGAQCIITSSYQAFIQGFLDVGYSRIEAEQLLLKTVTLAEIALEKYQQITGNKTKPLIAASIGPYGAYLADGSEYRGNYGVTDSALATFHQQQFQLLETTNADVYACETIPSFQEAKVLSELLEKVTKPAWVSFSCKDEAHINDGTPIQTAAALFKNHPNVFAIGVNCTAPKYISELIKALKPAVGNKKIIVYPNSGMVYNAVSKTWSGTAEPSTFVAMAKEWVDLGADIIGGCCQIGHRHIRGVFEGF